jgi:uncharacterized protein YcbX
MSKRKVTELWVYPIKSLGGIRVQSARVLQKGLEADRRWMLIDDRNVFMTQRIHHGMALFRTGWQGTLLSVAHLGESISIPRQPSGEEVKAQIWDDVVSVREVDPKVSKWFSVQLSMSCRLVAFPEENYRGVDPKHSAGDDQVSLADAYPLMVIGQSSLDDLNRKMAKAVPMNRFRPNIVFTGGEAFEEDSWKQFKIGNNRFAAVKPCSRCVLPTIDQDTGIMGKEPMATLNKYRKRESKVYFGMNLVPLDHGEIRVDDEITF